MRASGFEARVIASEMGLSYHTVRSYLKLIHARLQVSNGIELSNVLNEREVLMVPRSECQSYRQAWARSVTKRAIQRGELEKGPCEVCGAEKVDAHHEDYTKPLDVRWLCSKHHAEVHRKT